MKKPKVKLDELAKKLENKLKLAKKEVPKHDKKEEKIVEKKEQAKSVDMSWKAIGIIPEESTFVIDDEPRRFVGRRNLVDEAFEDSPLTQKSVSEDTKSAYVPADQRPGEYAGASYAGDSKYKAEVSEFARTMERAREADFGISPTERLMQSTSDLKPLTETSGIKYDQKKRKQ